MNQLKMKQMLLIAYTIISIVFGLCLGAYYDEFTYLVPIVLVSLFSFYFLCRLDDRVNFRGILIYVVVLAITFAILLPFLSAPYIDAIRLMCMKALSVMFTILGTLAGGILRYKFYQMERKKEMESEGYERTEK